MKEKKSSFKKIIKWGVISFGSIIGLIILFFVFLIVLGNLTSSEDSEIVNEYYIRFDKVMLGKVWPITDYGNYEGSKSMVENALTKISDAEKEINELESLVEKAENEEFISVNKEYLGLVKQLLAKEKGLYEIELKIVKLNERGSKKDKLEELLNGIIGCSCDKLDCDSYYTSSIEYRDDVAETFAGIDVTYIKEKAEYFREEKVLLEKHLPGLIKQSKQYDEHNCYRINDEYNEFYADFQELDTIDEGELETAFTAKYDVPIDNLIDELNTLSVDFDRVRAEVLA